MKSQFALSVVFSLIVSTNAFAGQKVKHCSPSSKAEVEDSLDFLKNNLNTIMVDVGDLTQNEKDKLRRKIDSVDIKCMDHKPVCQNHEDRGGVSRHIFESAVVICYNRIRDVGGSAASCTLADVLLHEIAHTADVHHANNHNDGPNSDRVYRTGLAASDRCFELGRASSIPRNTNDE